MNDPTIPPAALPPRGIFDRGVTRRPLKDGHWVDVRNEITAGERDDAYDVAYETRFSVADGHQLVLNRRTFMFAQVAVHIAGWSWMHFDGSPIAWDVVGAGADARPATLAERVQTLRNEVTPEEWDELRDVVNAHTDVIEAARLAKKKSLNIGDAAAPSS